MEDNNELLKSMTGGQCPHCKKDFVMGIGMHAPVATFILSREQLEYKKATLIEEINKSGLNDLQKSSLLSQYSNPNVMIDPDIADFMIEELRTKYANTVAPEAPKTEEELTPETTQEEAPKKKAPKKDAPKAPKSK